MTGARRAAKTRVGIDKVRENMKRSILALGSLLLAVLAVGATLTARAEDGQSAPGAQSGALPFWGIDLKDFYADTPRPISVPGAGGVLDHYWYWTFKFKFVTNLEELKKHYEAVCKELEKGTGADEAEMLRKNIARIEETIKHIERTRLYATVYADNGAMLTDSGNEVIRNLAEKEVGRRLYTTKEIATLNLNEVPESRDPDNGNGRWVYGVAVFGSLPMDVREFEIRISGLGKRILPMFMPGRLFYPASTLSMSEAIQPTMRRNLRYFYRKIGQTAELGLTPVKYEGRKAEWLWMWPMQIYLGRYREVEIERASGLKRRYVYAPYYVWNNTHLPQPLTVVKAGLSEDIVWGGEKIAVTMTDDGGADERWKLQVADRIQQRLESGEEKEYAGKYEAYPVRYSSVDLEQYYKDTLKIDYIPEGTDDEKSALRDKLKNNDTVAKLTDVLDKRKAEDIERKLKFLPEGDRSRLYSGTIEAGKIVTGVLIVRWGVEDLNATVDELIARLRLQSLMGKPADDLPLLAGYNAMMKAQGSPDAPWTRPAGPTREAVVTMLVQKAAAELKEKNIEVTEDDTQRYGTLAPIGVLLNHLAWARLVERAEKNGATDGFFEVRVGDMKSGTESSTLISYFQRFLPKEHAPLPPIPDDFKDEGSQHGISKGAIKALGGAAAAGDGKAGEEKASEKKVEDSW